jgi:hypothetical protein
MLFARLLDQDRNRVILIRKILNRRHLNRHPSLTIQTLCAGALIR